MEKEIWKDVPNYEGLYQVSNLGNVKSLKFNHNNYEKIMKPTNDGKYYVLNLYKNKVMKRFRVHNLIAITFLKLKTDKNLIIDHIDNNPLNNNVNNLQQISYRENNSKDKKGGTSKYIGVSFNKKSGKWQSMIVVKGKHIYLGLYEDELKASNAYQNKLKTI